MIEFLDCKINKTKPVATDIFLTFKDIEVGAKQFKFLESRLGDYILEIDSGCNMKSETRYNESSKVLLMSINITVPDHLLPESFNKSAELIAHYVTSFQRFYRKQKDLFISVNFRT